MVYTLGTAAKATGKSKTAIATAVKNGRLRAILKDDGSYEIPADELAKVYTILTPLDSQVDPLDCKHGHLDSQVDSLGVNVDSQPVNIDLKIELEVTKAKLESALAERDSWKESHARLIDAMNNRERSLRLLDHKQKIEVPEPEKQDPTESKLYQKLFGRLK